MDVFGDLVCNVVHNAVQKRGESVHPFSDKRKTWLRKWSSVLDARMLNIIRFQSSRRSFLGAAPADLMKAAISVYPQSSSPSVWPSRAIADV